jgi:serine/threonine-protein kinase
MPLVATASLIEALRSHRLLEPDQMGEVSGLAARLPDARALARELIGRDWLTPYQANQLLQGRGEDLVLGQYVLLERLGEGGMGQVFKARHRILRRVVALKVIRKERLDRPEVVRRFQREVQAAAQLQHPNVVHAFDAGRIGTTHFIAMEFVDGIDLSRLIRQQGPLGIEQACDYIRQAALGLQHAHERGLVHRDIKPANLLATRVPGSDGKPGPGGTKVKVLDMGLARLNPALEDEATRGLTQEGTVVGTVDYLAPEQAVNASHVDIRADIYSLGCTFYHLLTGQAPFAGDTALDKLLKHRCEEAVPVEHLRPEVPPGLAAVVRKMMAKQPGDRYQTPAEVALALSALAGTGSPTRNQAVPGVPAAEPQPVTVPCECPAELAETAGPWATLPLSQPCFQPAYQRRRARNRQRFWFFFALATATFTGGALLLVLLLRS